MSYTKSNEVTIKNISVNTDFDEVCTLSSLDESIMIPKRCLVEVNSQIPKKFNEDNCVIDEVTKLKTRIINNFIITKPFNYYAIIRTPDIKWVVVESLKLVPGFYLDKNLNNSNKNKAIERIGNFGNIVFFYCPIFTKLNKYHIDFGIKFKDKILSPIKVFSQISFTLQFPRLVIKDALRPTFDWKEDDFEDSEPKTEKAFKDKTTEIIKNESFDITKIPSSIPISKLPPKERELIGKPIIFTFEGSVPITKLPEEEKKLIGKSPAIKVNKDVEDSLLSNKPILPIEKEKAELEESEERLIKQIKEAFIKINKNEEEKLLNIHEGTKLGVSSCGIGISENILNSSPVSGTDYETKKRCFGQVSKDSNLPEAFKSATKGFYIKEENELVILKKFSSEESILNYKLNRIYDYSEKMNVYSKEEHDNLAKNKITYVKPEILGENGVKFVLVDSEINLNYYDANSSKISIHMSPTLHGLIAHLNKLSKEGVLFIKNIKEEDYLNSLVPSFKNHSEYIVKCYVFKGK